VAIKKTKKKNHTLYTAVRPGTYKWLEKTAERRGVALSAIVRELLEQMHAMEQAAA
jgi:hypothetical protein